ncbi:uncharacterized protein LOC143018001 [Oratosquilla oratoria]|uniref:uncharacterized protein LOC143018001 n=1 Tax=Oratosquilla oratoria TaxID=337810 RepID=UPI003F76F6B4
MKAVILLALVACAAAMPAPEAEADPLTLLHPYGAYPLIHSPLVKLKTVETTDVTPLVYSGLPLTYHTGLPLTYHAGLPFAYNPFLPLVAKPAEEAAPAVEEA